MEKAVAAVSGPRRRVLDALIGRGQGVPAAPVIMELIATLPLDLTDAEATQLIAMLSKDAPTTPEEVLEGMRRGVAVLRQNKASKPGGLTADQKDALVSAAKALSSSFPKGRIQVHAPDRATAGKSYGLQLVGRTSDGFAYAAMASVRIDSVKQDVMTGTVLAHSDCIGVDGTAVFPAGKFEGAEISTVR